MTLWLLSSSPVLMSHPWRGHPETTAAVRHPASPAALAEEQGTHAEPLVPLCNLLNTLPKPTSLFLTPCNLCRDKQVSLSCAPSTLFALYYPKE